MYLEKTLDKKDDVKKIDKKDIVSKDGKKDVQTTKKNVSIAAASKKSAGADSKKVPDKKDEVKAVIAASPASLNKDDTKKKVSTADVEKKEDVSTRKSTPVVAENVAAAAAADAAVVAKSNVTSEASIADSKVVKKSDPSTVVKTLTPAAQKKKMDTVDERKDTVVPSSVEKKAEKDTKDSKKDAKDKSSVKDAAKKTAVVSKTPTTSTSVSESSETNKTKTTKTQPVKPPSAPPNKKTSKSAPASAKKNTSTDETNETPTTKDMVDVDAKHAEKKSDETRDEDDAAAADDDTNAAGKDDDDADADADADDTNEEEEAVKKTVKSVRKGKPATTPEQKAAKEEDRKKKLAEKRAGKAALKAAEKAAKAATKSARSSSSKTSKTTKLKTDAVDEDGGDESGEGQAGNDDADTSTKETKNEKKSPKKGVKRSRTTAEAESSGTFLFSLSLVCFERILDCFTDAVADEETATTTTARKNASKASDAGGPVPKRRKVFINYPEMIRPLLRGGYVLVDARGNCLSAFPKPSVCRVLGEDESFPPLETIELDKLPEYGCKWIKGAEWSTIGQFTFQGFVDFANQPANFKGFVLRPREQEYVREVAKLQSENRKTKLNRQSTKSSSLSATSSLDVRGGPVSTASAAGYDEMSYNAYLHNSKLLSHLMETERLGEKVDQLCTAIQTADPSDQDAMMTTAAATATSTESKRAASLAKRDRVLRSEKMVLLQDETPGMPKLIFISEKEFEGILLNLPNTDENKKEVFYSPLVLSDDDLGKTAIVPFITHLERFSDGAVTPAICMDVVQKTRLAMVSTQTPEQRRTKVVAVAEAMGYRQRDLARALSHSSSSSSSSSSSISAYTVPSTSASAASAAAAAAAAAAVASLTVHKSNTLAASSAAGALPSLPPSLTNGLASGGSSHSTASTALLPRPTGVGQLPVLASLPVLS